MSLKPRVQIKKNDKKLKAFLRTTKSIDKQRISAGIFQSAGKYKSGISVSDVAAIQEFGSSDGFIPERPWMRGWFDANQKRIETYSKSLVTQVGNGRRTVDKAMDLYGSYIVRGLKQSIKDMSIPPNAFSTIIKKGKNDPLVDTGRMMNSVEFRVNKGASK